MPRAVVCRELGPPERLRLETFASAPLAAGQVRVAVHAAGINFPDILMAAGEYQLKPDLPFTPGVEAAGEVTEVNGAAGVAVGDKVILRLRHSAYADEAVVTPAQLTPLPQGFDYAEGATFLAAHGTAYHALIDRGQIQPDEVLLVHGAGGGVGLAAVEIGKLLGATVIAAASSDDKLGAARAKGADHLVLYGREPFRDAVKRITEGRGGVRPRRRRDIREQPALHRLGRAYPRDRFHRRDRTCADEFADDQGRQRAWRPCGRGRAEKSGAGRRAAEGADGVGGSRAHQAQHLASIAAGKLRAGDAALDGSQGDRKSSVDDAVMP